MPILLPLNLQFFAEPDDLPKPDEVNDEPTLTDEDPENKPEEGKTFTQEELDRIIADRLDRERKKREQAVQKEREEAERKKLEDQQQYKELADKYRGELDAIKAEALNAKKDAMLVKAGYNDEQVERYRKYLEGESDEELTKALDDLKADVPPKKTYVDPSAGNGGKDKPKPTDLNEKGKSAYQRLKSIGRIR